MKKIYNLLFILFISINGFGFSTDTIFINRTGTTVQKDSARFYRLITFIDSNLYKIEDHFLTGQIQMLSYNNYPNLTIKKGKFIFYDSLGNISSETEYSKSGKRIGEWKEYYFGTNKLKNKKIFNDNNKSYSYFKYDSTTQNIVESKEYNNEGRLTGIYKQYNSKDSKIWIIRDYTSYPSIVTEKEFHSNGSVKRIIEYKNGKFVNGKMFDEIGNKIKFYPLSEAPKYKISINDYLVKNISFFKNKKIENLVVQFKVSSKAILSEIEIIENEYPETNDEIINALKLYTKIKPGMRNNIPIDCIVKYHINSKYSYTEIE